MNQCWDEVDPWAPPSPIHKDDWTVPRSFAANEHSRQIGSPDKPMTPEQKLWFAVALCAVVDEDKEFIASVKFDALCGLANVKPALLRNSTVAQAQRALKALHGEVALSDEIELEEAA